MSDTKSYRALADQQYALAATAELQNVRERAERSAKAWTAMADRAELTAAMREKRDGRR